MRKKYEQTNRQRAYRYTLAPSRIKVSPSECSKVAATVTNPYRAVVSLGYNFSDDESMPAKRHQQVITKFTIRCEGQLACAAVQSLRTFTLERIISVPKGHISISIYFVQKCNNTGNSNDT